MKIIKEVKMKRRSEDDKRRSEDDERRMMNNEREDDEGWGEDFSTEGGANIMWSIFDQNV